MSVWVYRLVFGQTVDVVAYGACGGVRWAVYEGYI